MKTEEELRQAGLTANGLKRYKDTVADFEKTLLEKSLVYAEADKADDMDIEVTHDHIRSAAHSIASTFSKQKPSPWGIPVQIGEYFFTALAGVGGGAFKETWGIPLFTVCIAIAVILFVVRNTTLRQS